jgi:hypothetical protein
MASLAGGPSFPPCEPGLLASGPESLVLPVAMPGSPVARALTGSGECGVPVDLWCRWP